MKLSASERLILSMLCDLSKPEGKREFDYDFISKAIGWQHEWALTWRYDFLRDGPEETPPDVAFVVDVLDMWHAIELAVSEMTPEQQERLRAEVGYGKSLPAFRGFDGNSEARLIGIARMFIDDMDRWTHFHGREFNSHMPTRAVYSRQLEVFKPMRPSLGERATPYMSPEQVISIVRESVHPENRVTAADGSWTVKPRDGS